MFDPRNRSSKTAIFSPTTRMESIFDWRSPASFKRPISLRRRFFQLSIPQLPESKHGAFHHIPTHVHG